ncbi:MAG: B12-binding domain-containing radical SAM protein, partial [Candidatus Methylomirabilis sp.]|nr:B12-binding domain-containing radical SAM protein [Deltaproteobacteria bacterium]
MKILLVNPPEAHTLEANLPGKIDRARGVNPPIGMMYVAGSLRAAGFEVECLDAHAEGVGHAEIPDRIRRAAPDALALGTVTFTLIDALKVVAAAKAYDPDLPVVMGGLHPHLYPDETIRLPGIDYLLLGEAERSAVALFGNLGKHDRLKDVEGVVYRHPATGAVVNTGYPALLDDLDALPFPALDLMPIEKYSSVVTAEGPVTLMISSRGCPYGCKFCSRSITGKQYRIRSPENVVDEAERALGLGVREILFYDEVFGVQRDRAKAIAREILARGLRFNWMARSTINDVDPEMLALFKRAGCGLLTLGVEAASKKVLARMNKPVDLDEVHRVFKMTQNAGISTLAYFILGNPGETKDEVRQSIRYMVRLDPDLVHVAVYTAYPATEFYDEALRSGEIASDYWREFAANPT